MRRCMKAERISTTTPKATTPTRSHRSAARCHLGKATYRAWRLKCGELDRDVFGGLSDSGMKTVLPWTHAYLTLVGAAAALPTSFETQAATQPLLRSVFPIVD